MSNTVELAGRLPALRETLISVAPMMERTDRHCRYFMRLLSPNVRLYTEMVNANAILKGDPQRHLSFDASEHPVALQLGGNEPVLLAAAAKIAEDYGYDEINLNVGCPSLWRMPYGSPRLGRRLCECYAGICFDSGDSEKPYRHR
jgi:hypothetical protein